MHHDAQSLIGTASGRWARFGSLLCFAVACGLLIGSLAKVREVGPAADRTMARNADPLS
jgi:hypothetical protein